MPGSRPDVRTIPGREWRRRVLARTDELGVIAGMASDVGRLSMFASEDEHVVRPMRFPCFRREQTLPGAEYLRVDDRGSPGMTANPFRSHTCAYNEELDQEIDGPTAVSLRQGEH